MLQKTQIIGKLGKDPELNHTPSGQPVCNFSVATNRKWTDGNGEQCEETIWFRVSAWGKHAESCYKYLSKGSLVYCEGRLTLPEKTSQFNAFQLTALEVKFLSTFASDDTQLVEDDNNIAYEEVYVDSTRERGLNSIKSTINNIKKASKENRAFSVTCTRCNSEWKTKDYPIAYCPYCTEQNRVYENTKEKQLDLP